MSDYTNFDESTKWQQTQQIPGRPSTTNPNPGNSKLPKLVTKPSYYGNPTKKSNDSKKMPWDKIALVIMIVAIVFALGVCGYLLYNNVIAKDSTELIAEENDGGDSEGAAPEAPAPEKMFIDEKIGNVTFKLIKVKGGTFSMGSVSGSSNEAPVHQVTLNDFYIGETEVTQELWEAVMGLNLDYYRRRAEADFGWVCDFHGKGPKYPMYYVSWNDCVDFVNKLNASTGKTYSLPTEAQWEYAARGGNKSQGYIYSGSNSANEVAWFGSTIDRGGTCYPVKTKQPNELGIYDMSGNIREWCNDRYSSTYYSSSPSTEPQGPSSGSKRVLRGGSWRDGANDIKVTKRLDQNAYKHYNRIGLRIVLNGVQ